MSHWQDKVALVTGGTRGLGRALVDQLAEAGAQVAFLSRSSDDVEAVARQLEDRGLECLGVVSDITLQEDVERAVEQTIETFGRLDLLINNAGLSDRGRGWETPIDRFEQLLELNVLGSVRCTQQAMPHLLETKGKLVFIASLAGRSGFPNLGAYPASKFAVVGYSHQLRLELADQGVDVLQVCTGPIQRDDAGSRYEDRTADLPKHASEPGGGVGIKGIPAEKLAKRILAASAAGKSELVIPVRARLLLAISQLFPGLGDWILRKGTKR